MEISNLQKKGNWSVYKITNPSEKVYIGITINLRKRFNSYRAGHSKSQRLIHRSMNKYGFDNHSVEIIDKFSGTSLEANSKEIFWIRTYMSFNQKWPEMGGLNLTMGGSGQLGKTHNEKQIESNKIHGKRLHTPEMNIKRALGQVGKKMPSSFAIKISKSHTGHTWMRGVKFSEDGKAKCRHTQRRINGLKIAQYSLDKVLISNFESAQDVSEKTGISPTRIYGAIKKRTICDDFIFIQQGEDEEILQVYKYARPFPIVQVSLDGSLINEYPSVPKAAYCLGLTLNKAKYAVANENVVCGSYMIKRKDINMVSKK